MDTKRRAVKYSLLFLSTLIGATLFAIFEHLLILGSPIFAYSILVVALIFAFAPFNSAFQKRASLQMRITSFVCLCVLALSGYYLAFSVNIDSSGPELLIGQSSKCTQTLSRRIIVPLFLRFSPMSLYSLSVLEDTCKATRIGSLLRHEPQRLCPSIKAENTLDCYNLVLDTLGKSLWTVTGRMLLLMDATNVMNEKSKDNHIPHIEAFLNLAEILIRTAEVIPKERAEDSKNREIKQLHTLTRTVATISIFEIIEKSEGIFKITEGKLRGDREIASIQKQAYELRQNRLKERLSALIEKWRYSPQTKRRLEEAARKAGFSPNSPSIENGD